MRLKLTQPVLNYDGTPILAGKTNPDGSAVIGADGRQEQVPETLRATW